MVKKLDNAEEFKSKVMDVKGQLVMVDFFATWCGPCRMIAPKIEEFEKTFTGVAFYKIDVDEVEDVAGEQGVSAMPTFFFYKDGQKVDEVVGANEQAIKEAIQKHQ